MQLSLDLPYRVPNDERVKREFPNGRVITMYLLNTAMHARFRESGMGRTETRLWGAMQDAALDAEQAGTLTIAVSRDVLQFVYEQFDKWNPPPAFASWCLVLLDGLKAHLDKKGA